MALCAAGLATPVHQAKATVLVYEGFTGYGNNGDNMGSKAVTGTGLTGSYATGGNGAIVYNTSGLAFSNLATSGGSISQINNNTGSFIGASLAAGAATTGTLYASYLVRFSATPTVSPTTSAQVGVNSTTTGVGANRYFNIMADSGAANNVNPGFGYGFNATAETAPLSLSANTTYMVLAEIQNVGINTTNGVGTVWVLTESQYDTFKVGGFSTAALNSAAVGTGATDVNSRYTSAAPASGTFLFDQTRALQFSLTPLATSTSTMDEIRFGTTIGDVTLQAVPENSSSVLLLGAGLALCAVRKRRSKQS